MDVIKIEDLEAYKLDEGITRPDKRCGTCGHHVNGRCMRIPYSNRIADVNAAIVARVNAWRKQNEK